ncbi:hypothetical protein [Kitasatospora sp. MAP5-34]|uniref:hypothetical protein n=1 Tax=Kitasatospora sp. MAP5-34 TaxID=3035102 RepID=UPI002473A6F5|nr:hypothetical protein [Kitasatospora sp. MAP5-34]MDH6578231.1 hypothetical protein [Kitasatospora sp. MAP5-34]
MWRNNDYRPTTSSPGVRGGVESADQLPVAGPHGLEFFGALRRLTREVDCSLFEGGDAALELVDVVGATGSGVPPSLFAEESGELVLQVPDPSGEAAGAFLDVGQVAVADPAELVGVISGQRTEYGIRHTVTCRALGVSRAWFYKWR